MNINILRLCWRSLLERFRSSSLCIVMLNAVAKPLVSIQGHVSLINPVTLIMAKTLLSFGLSGCHRIKADVLSVTAIGSALCTLSSTSADSCVNSCINTLLFVFKVSKFFRASFPLISSPVRMYRKSFYTTQTS